MKSHDAVQFFTLYQKYRFEDQQNFYERRYTQFEAARTQALIISITLMAFTAIAAFIPTISNLPTLPKLICLLLAAILPVLSTAIAAYNALYGFEQQALLYKDTVDALFAASIHAPVARPTDPLFTQDLEAYVLEVEKIIQSEQGQWGQIAQNLKPPE